MEEFLVGSFEYPVSHLVSNLAKCDSFFLLFHKWEDIGRDLEADSFTIEKLRLDLIQEKLQLSGVVARILENWSEREGDKALLGKLAQIFASNGLSSLSEFILNLKPKAACQNVYPGMQYGITPPVSDFTGRDDSLSELHEKLNGNKSTVVTQMTTVSGLGGIGKTELCRMYVERFKTEYEYIIWITADDKGNLEKSFKAIAEKSQMRIPTSDKDGNPRPMGKIVSDVYEKLEKVKGLLIFDNADRKEAIAGFLPHKYLKMEECQLHFLITSRLFEWSFEEFHVIRLHGLKKNDAVEYVKMRLKLEFNEDIEKMVELLSKQDHNGDDRCFPLALRQAVAYIKQKKYFKKDYSIKEYLTEFENSFHSKFEEVESYTHTTYTTWQMTITAIKEHKPFGHLAVKLFNMMAFLNPEDIQKKLFFTQEEEQSLIHLAIDLLVKYCMIDESQDVLSIHRLVQAVTRQKLRVDEEHDMTEEICRETISLLNGIPTEERDLKHAVSVWSYSSNKKEIINRLYSHSKYKFRLTPLHLLCHKDYTKNSDSAVNLIKTLKDVKNKKELNEVLNEKDDFDRTALWIAADTGNFETLKALLENKANPRIVSNMGMINPRVNMSALGIFGQSPLHRAAFHGFIKCVQLLLESDRSLFDLKDVKGRTALDMAVFGGAYEVVKYMDGKDKARYLFALIRHKQKTKSFEKFKEILLGLNKDEREKLINCEYQSKNVLHEAVVVGHPVSRLEFLVENGINLRPERGSFTAFLYAVYGRHLEAVKYFASLGAHPTKDTNGDGWTALHAACQHGELEIVKYFISEFPDLNLNVKDPKLDSPLHTACIHAKPEVVRFLLEQHGLEVNAINRMEITPICSAALTGSFEVVFIILERCPEVKLKPEEVDPGQNFFCSSIGISVAHFAAAYGNQTVLKECKNRGMDVDIGKNKGVSPLHSAVFFNQLKTVQYLVEQGADIEAEVNVANVIAAVYTLLSNNDTFNWNNGYLLSIMRCIYLGRHLLQKAIGKLTPITVSEWDGICSKEIKEYLKLKKGFQKVNQPGPELVVKCILKLEIIQKYLKFVHGFVKQEVTIGKEGANIINALSDVAQEKSPKTKDYFIVYCFLAVVVGILAIYKNINQ